MSKYDKEFHFPNQKSRGLLKKTGRQLTLYTSSTYVGPS